MKKRLLSLALCLALCLGLFPFGALATDGSRVYEGTGDPEAASVISVNGTTTNYATLPAALNAARDGDTVKLLENHTTNWSNVEAGEYSTLAVIEKTLTLDLNGRTVDYLEVGEVVPDEEGGILESTDGNLTVADNIQGGSHGRIKNLKFVKGSLAIQGGWIGDYDGSKLTCNGNSGTVTISGGTVCNATVGTGTTVTVSGGSMHQEQWVNNGTLNIMGGTFGSVKFYNNSGTIAISGGTFSSLQNFDNTSSLIAPMSLLAPGHAFYKDNTVQDGSKRDYLQNVTVKEHTHTMVINKCACGYTCPHTLVDANGACEVCKKQFAASVTAGEDVTYYDGLGKALNYANQNKGCTLKLLANVESAVSVEAPLIFDLNGHNVQRLSVCAKATIRDSGTEKGKIGKVLIFDKEGETPNLTLGDLLEEGYAFKYENDTWVNDSHVQTSDELSVTVEEAPIKRVVLDAIGADKKEVPTTMAYGTTGAVTLEASCWTAGTNPPTYTWYKLEGAAATAPMEGVNGVKYKLPADLPAGKHTYLVTCTSGGYSKSAEITITVTKIDLANATVTIDPWPADGKFRFNPYAPETAALSFLSAVKVTANGKEDRLSDSDFTYTGATATRVGKYTLTITATDSCANYKGSKTFDWEVIPYQLYRPAFQGSQTYKKTYDGTTTLPGSYTWLADFFGREGIDPNVTLESGDYEVTAAEFVSADAGENKPINQTITLKNDNFVFSPTEIINVKGITTTDKTLTYTNFTPTEAYPSGGTTFNIEKATMPNFDKEVTLDIVNNHADTYTVDLSALLPKLESPRTYGDTQYEVDQSSVKELTHGYNAIQDVGFAVNPDNGKTQLTFHAPAVENHTEGSVGAIKITVTPTNYKPVTLTVNLRSVNKQRLGMFVSVTTDPIVYGMTLGDIKLSAEATVDGQVIPGTIAWEDPLTTVPAAGRATYRWTFTPDDTMHYLTASNTITFLVDKATPTGAPAYTAITTSGKTLKDAGLTVNENWPEGSIHWVDANGTEMDVDTAVSANTAYTWKFVPTDTDNYNDLTGTITLWHKSSSSSSSGSVTPGTKTDTVKNPDGSTTKTETKADGSKTETTTASSGGGSTGTTVTKTDANGNTTTEASAKLSDRDVKEAQEKGEAVTVPVKGIAAAKDANAATKIKIDVPNNANKTTVEIPVENVTSGTVAVIVHEDGTEELVKDSKPTEHGVQLELSGSTTVKIIDNSKTFDDTKDHWSRDEVNFVAARELFNGVGGNQFGVSQPMTRGMVNTVLARLAGVDTTPSQGQAWYEVGTDWAKKNGISDGTNPTAPVTREQLATLLYRYAGSPSVSGTLHAADAASVSDYAEDALLWANQNGIVNGVGSNTIAPKDNAQRAQVAAMLARYLQNQ